MFSFLPDKDVPGGQLFALLRGQAALDKWEELESNGLEDDVSVRSVAQIYVGGRKWVSKTSSQQCDQILTKRGVGRVSSIRRCRSVASRTKALGNRWRCFASAYKRASDRQIAEAPDGYWKDREPLRR